MTEQILQRLDKLYEQLSHIDKRLEMYNSLLDVHIKRTDLNEASIKDLTEKAIEMSVGIRILRWVIGTGLTVAGLTVGAVQALQGIL